MKVLPQETKVRIRDARAESRRAREVSEREREMEHLVATGLRGRRAERIVFLALLALMGILCAYLGWTLMRQRRESMNRYRPATRAKFESLVSRARMVDRSHRSRFGKVDFVLLKNWALLENDPSMRQIRQEIENGRSAIAETRCLLKTLFADIFKIFPNESINERIDAQKLYGEIMGRVDADEIRLDNAESAIKLLNANRGRWRYRNGVVEFTQSQIETRFNFYNQGEDIATARWRKDFHTAVESDVVELPKEIADGEVITNPPAIRR